MHIQEGKDVRMYIHTRVCMHVYIYICMHVRMYVCMYTELIHETIRDNTCVCVHPEYKNAHIRSVCAYVCMYVCAVHRHRREYVIGVNNYQDFWGAPDAKLSTQAQTCAGWTTAQFMDLSCPKPKPYL